MNRRISSGDHLRDTRPHAQSRSSSGLKPKSSVSGSSSSHGAGAEAGGTGTGMGKSSKRAVAYQAETVSVPAQSRHSSGKTGARSVNNGRATHSHTSSRTHTPIHQLNASASASTPNLSSLSSKPTASSSSSSNSNHPTSHNNNREVQKSWNPPPSPIMQMEGNVDLVHWQSSQTTNPALRSLLKEASHESFANVQAVAPSARLGSSMNLGSTLSTRISPSRQPAMPADSTSTSKPSVSHSTRLRARHSASPVSRSGSDHELKTGKSEPNSPFSAGDPSKILEMMRGVSAMIDESTRSALNTPPQGAKAGSTKALARVSVDSKYRRSSMDIVVDDGQNSLAGLEPRNKKKGTLPERLKRDASLVPVVTPVDDRQGKGKGKALERETSMMMVDEDDDASVDVSMMDVSMADFAVDSVDSPTPALAAAVRRKEMLPPPIPQFKSRTPLVRSSSRGSMPAIHVPGPDPVQDNHSTRVISAPSAPKEPEVKLHPLLVEKKYLKESRRTYTAPNATNTNAGNPSASNTPAREPITRTSSHDFTATHSQSPIPPGASQSRLPPRLGMCRSRTAPLLTTSNVPPSGPTKLVATQSAQTKSLAKPFKPPFRMAPQDTAPQHNYPSRHNDADYNTQAATNPSRSAYPSPSPGSGDDGKNGDQSSRYVTGEYPAQTKPPKLRSPREHSPPVLPPTPESVSKGGAPSDTRGKGADDDDDEKMEDLGAPDQDSSFGDMTFDFSMDVLEETMKKYD